MASNKKPFHEEDYREENSKLCPILDILVGKTEVKISAYVDTGCDYGIAFHKEHIKNLDIGEKINDEPEKVQMADGRLIGCDLYCSTVKLGNDTKEVLIVSIDPEEKLGSAPLKESIPLIGRNYLDNFDVFFKGRFQKIVLFK